MKNRKVNIISDMSYFKLLKFKFDKKRHVQAAKKYFNNGFGISVIRGFWTKGGPNLFEAAILDSQGKLVYDTGLAEDVIGYLTSEEVVKLMKQIEKL